MCSLPKNSQLCQLWLPLLWCAFSCWLISCFLLRKAIEHYHWNFSIVNTGKFFMLGFFFFFFLFMLKSLKYSTLGINSGSGKSNEQKHLLEGNLNLYYMKWKLLIKYAFISSFSWSFNKVSKGIKRKQKRITKNEGRERWWEISTEFSGRWKAAGEWCSVKEAINMGAYVGSYL